MLTKTRRRQNRRRVMLEMPQFTRPKVSQRVAMAKALLPRAQAEARKRRRTGKRAAFSAPALDVVAAHVGWSRTTLAKAIAVTKAAVRNRLKFGDLMALMDQTGRVDRAYRDMRAREGKSSTSDQRRRKKRLAQHDLLLEQLGALSIDKADHEIASCRLRIEVLEGFIAEAQRCFQEPPRRRRFLNILPIGVAAKVIASVQNKQEPK